MRLIKVIPILFLFLGAVLSETSQAASIGDAKTVYGNASAPAGALKIRSYALDSGGTGVWSAVGTLPTANTTIVRSVIRANPWSDEYIAAVGTSGANQNLYVYTCTAGAWSLSWATTIPSAVRKSFDIEYEQNSGDAIVVYSSGSSPSNELSYRKRVDGSWDGSRTDVSLAQTSGPVYWLELEARPSSDEIALACSDSGSDINALIWDGSNWGSEPTYVLNNNAVNTDQKKFDVAYEQSSGDCFIASGINAAAGIRYATKAAGVGTWSTGSFAALDIAASIDAAAEPGTDYIGVGSLFINATSADLQAHVWTGTNWTGPGNNLDITCVAVAYYEPVACGWSGTGTDRRLQVVYADVASQNVTYFSWRKSSQTWSTQRTYAPTRVSSITHAIQADEDPNFSTNGRLWVTTVDGAGGYWTFATTGTGASQWLTIDDGTAGNNAIETNVNIATMPVASLAITAYNPTLVELLDFNAGMQDNQAVIRWVTGSEVLTSGFRLYRALIPGERESYEEITTGLIRPFGNPFSGRTYQVVDPLPLSGSYYVLEEVLKNGHTKTYPAVVLSNTPLAVLNEQARRIPFRRDGRFEYNGLAISRRLWSPGYSSDDPYLYPGGATRSGLRRAFRSTRSGYYENTGVKIKCSVNQEGVYRLTAQDLTAAGWRTAKIDPRTIRILNQGAEVPLYVATKKYGRYDVLDYLEFYGRSATGRYTKTNVYWVVGSLRPGERVSLLNYNPRSEVVDTYMYPHVESGDSYFPEFEGDQHWFFSDEFISPMSVNYTFTVDRLSTDMDQAQVEVILQGGSRVGIGPDYTRQHAAVSLNGNLLGDAQWEGDVEYSFAQDVPRTYLVEGLNTLTIEAPDEGGTLQQYFLLNRFSVTYPRQLWATANEIIFDSNAQDTSFTTYKVRGFTSSAIRHMAWLKDTSSYFRIAGARVQLEPEGDYSYTFGDSSPAGKRYCIVAQSQVRIPSNITKDEPSRLKYSGNQSDYIIIAPAGLIDALAPLVSLRRSQGLNVTVVDIQDVYDEFNNGIFSPQAIKSFLDYAYHGWRAPAPLFVLLVGDATFDYQDYYDLGVANVVPGYLVHNQGFGETVSDHWFVDFDNDMHAAMLIGRLPVNTASEVTSVVNKIVAYEYTSPAASWADELMFVADDEADFEETSDALAALIPPGYTVENMKLRGSSAAALRAGIINGINDGRFSFTYTGHSGITLLSTADIFNTGDVPSLTNTTAYTIFTSLNCFSGYFIYPQALDCLAEVLLRAQDKGAVACIVPSGISSPPEQFAFMQAFYSGIFDSGDYILGAAIQRAKVSLTGQGVRDGQSKEGNVIQTYNLLGDPALIIRKDGAPVSYTNALMESLRDMVSD